MPSYVVITDSAGVALGAGPIYRATGWTAVNRLDRAGRCSFEVPAADPRAQELLANKREAHYYTLRDGSPAEIGALIIDQIEMVLEGRSEPMLRVSGDNLLAELSTRTVGALELYETEAHTAHSVAHTYLDGSEYVTADMPEAYDGSIATTYALDTGLKTTDYLYVCGQSKISAIWITFGSGTNSNTAEIAAQYYDGSSWQSCEAINDGTWDTNRTWFKTGGIFFTRPGDQVATTHNDVEGYWIRLTPTANLSDGIIIADISVEEDIPTADGLAAIMALAPDGWAVSADGYAATEKTAYLQYGGETVLEALIALAEHTGEHFRLGTGKTIEWLQDDPRAAPVDSGVYAVAGPASGSHTCAILELAESKESYELATRIYPYGARQGNGRVTLALCTEMPPAGYTLSTVDNYLKADTAENTYGQIDHVREWPDIGQQDDDAYHAVLAANSLYQVALEWLQRYSAVQHAYTLRVAHLEQEVQPGETVRVTYQRSRDGERYIDIDRALVVLGVTLEEDGAGIRTAALELATIDTWPLSGTDFVLREMQAGRRLRAGDMDTSTTITQTIVSDNVNIDGGTIDGTAIGSNVPASGVFTTLGVSGASVLAGGVAVTGNIGVTGTVDGIDISSHAANPAAHHAPVTAGNSGIGVVGQAVSLALAPTSGLDLTAGLALADSVAGNGLAIANKVLGVGQGAGLTVSADAVALTTPGTLSVSSTNNAAGSHTHAVTASSNPNGEVSALLKSDEYGGLTLEALQTHGAVTVDQGLTAAASAFRVIHHTHDYAHSHVVINPTAGWALDEQFGLDVDDSLLVRGWIVGKHALQIPGAAMICHYDGPAPFETNFTGNPTGHMGQVATVSGGIIYRPGVFGKAVQVAEATTNLIRNPSAETNISFWNFVGGGTSGTAERSAAAAWIGSYGLRWVLGSSPISEPYCYQTTGAAPTQGTTYTGQVRVRAVGSAIGKTALIGIGAIGGAQADQYAWVFTTLTGGWQWVSVSLTVADADRTNMLLRVGYSAGAVGGDELHIDAAQMEARGYATPYCDGSLGAGHSWSGTAHASTSSRAAARLVYPLGMVTPKEGTIALWVSRQWGSETMPNRFVDTEVTNGPVMYVSSSAPSQFRFNMCGTGAKGGDPSDYVPWEWVHCVLTWDATTVRGYLNGEEFGSGAISTPCPSLPNITIGNRTAGNYSLNGYIDDVLIVERALSADEVRAIYESNAPVFAETSTWQWRAGRNLVWADAEGLWAVDETGAAMFAVSGTSKSWGGASLGAGDVFVGNVAQGQYLHWDDSAGKLTVRGDVAVSGSVSVAWQDITNPPDGANRLGTATRGGNPGAAGLWLTGYDMGYWNGSTWPVYIRNNGQFYFSKDANNYIKWDGTTFEVKGRVVVTEGTTVDTLPDGSTYGKVNKTIISGGNIQVGTGTKDSNLNGWAIDSTEIVGQAGDGLDQVVLGTDGAIKAGGGNVLLNADGMTIVPGSAYRISSALTYKSGTTNYAELYHYVPAGDSILVLEAKPVTGGQTSMFIKSRGATGYAGQLFMQATASSGNSELRVCAGMSGTPSHYVEVYGPLLISSYGLEVGQPGKATTDGGVQVEKYVGVGINYTPGTGNVDASGYVRGQKGLVLGDGQTAPTAASGIAFIYVDSADGDLKVRFGDGTTKTLATDT